MEGKIMPAIETNAPHPAARSNAPEFGAMQLTRVAWRPRRAAKEKSGWSLLMKRRTSKVISLAAAAGVALLGQMTKPAIADESSPITLIAKVCMKTFVHGERKELCGDFQVKPEGPSARFSDQASCEAGKGEALKDWRRQAAQTGMAGPDDRVENVRCVRTEVVEPSRN
jgi:hypothetical protein